MINKTPWFKREFPLDLPLEAFPGLVERLRGTPARLEDRVGSLKAEILTRRHGDTWSIQENVGHLLDLEPLWLGRVQDLLALKEGLRPADLKNKKTHEANHNASPLRDLLGSFRRARQKLVERFDGTDRASVGLSAFHPRLGKPMRMIDLALFVAEHDDHHLVRITELLQVFGEQA
jgi:uncharacterized damage-inducible protein DinB